LIQLKSLNTSKTVIDPKFNIVPKDYLENLKWRYFLDQACEEESMREFVLKKCSQGVEGMLYFFNAILWTHDPRVDEKTLPFITYPFQDAYVAWLKTLIDGGEDGLTEKSRDMGVSWMVLGVLYWYWLFDTGFSALIGSYIEDLIDTKESMDSHFGRLDFFIQNTPEWMLPQKYRAYMNLTNKTRSNSIVGYAPTERFSRQGRYKVVWPDEFAFWSHGRSAWNSMGDSTKCRIPTSTVNGKGNKFAELALKSRIKKQTLHWKLHPKKDAEWYRLECERRTEEEVAQELDINYNKSLRGRVYDEFCERNYLEVQEYDPTQPLYVSWDFGGTDPTALIWFQIDKRTGTVRIIDAYQKPNKAIDYFVPFVTGEIKSFGGFNYKYDEMELEMINRHRLWQPAIHFGDPTGENKNQTSMTSVIKQLQPHGIYVIVNRKKFDLKTRVNATKLLIRRLVVHKNLYDFIDALENARLPQRKEDSQATTPNNKPIHDWTSHYRTALEYFAVNEPASGPKKPTVLPQDSSKFEKRMEDLERKIQKKSTPLYRTAC